MGWQGKWNLYANGDIVANQDDAEFQTCFSVYINGVEVTNLTDVRISYDDFRIENNLTSRNDTLSFSMEDATMFR